MKSAPKHKLEASRLEKLQEYNILDTDAEVDFDELTELASEICGTPISLISLVDQNRQWFKSKVGLDAEETNRDISFCSHAILQDEIFEVTDATADERFKDNPLVEGHPNIRFYAGYPLKSPEGLPMGTLCVIDEKPKTLLPQQRRCLEIISNQVIHQMELRLKTKKLEKSNQFKTEFLSNMSHEIRTPLNSIIGFSDFLVNKEDGSISEQQVRRYIENIAFSGKHLLTMINNVLDLSKIEAGKMPISIERFNIHDHIENVIDMLKLKASEQGIKISSNISTEDDYMVSLDPAKLSQILINLVNNAIKFSEEGSLISIDLKVFKNSLEFVVADQGIGISEEQLDKVFNKYHQVGEKKSHGTGLGLSITKALVELLNGTIEIKSKVKQGTIVSVNLPFDKPNKEKKKPSTIVSDGQIPKDSKILVVEDNLVNQALVEALLDNLDCQTLIVGTGEKGVEEIQKDDSDFDLVLMDLNLPGINGFVATEQIKSKKPEQKVVALTADVFSDEKIDKCFDGRLSKPITYDTLKGLLGRMLSAKDTI